MEQDDTQPEQSHGEMSMVAMGDLDEGAFAEASIQQILEHNCALRRNFESVTIIPWHFLLPQRDV